MSENDSNEDWQEAYPKVEQVEFPKTIHVAYAVCVKECGHREFIVDGSTQICEHCGKQMFRTEVREYRFITKAESSFGASEE